MHSTQTAARSLPFDPSLQAWYGPRQSVWRGARFSLPLGERCYKMGIVNVTPDSFSDGGRFLHEQAAVEQGKRLIEAGCEILDIGGESTRPGSRPVTAEEELERIAAVVRALVGQGALISVDTWKHEVAAAVLAEGADIINDIYALQGDPAMAAVVARYQAAVILMHHPAYYRPEHPESQVFPKREGLAPPSATLTALAALPIREAQRRFLDLALQTALAAGIDRAQIMLDPGVGFGLTPAENLELVEHLDDFAESGLALLLAPSRKRFIRGVVGAEPAALEAGTAATLIWGMARGADCLRLHAPEAMTAELAMAEALFKVAGGGRR